jgi:molecular chaperone IbpA
MNQLVRFDTNSLNRALLGFDNLFDNFEQRFANQINQNYPPYNILKHNDDSYELEIAVTGFEKDEITVEIDQNQLVVKGQRNEADAVDPTYLHRGLSTRDFTRSWTLAEHMEVGRIRRIRLLRGIQQGHRSSCRPTIQVRRHCARVYGEL